MNYLERLLTESELSVTMHLQAALATLAALVSLAGADRLRLAIEVDLDYNYKYFDGRWDTAYGTYPVNPQDGCQDPPHVPGLNNLCLDWNPQHRRGHFYFDNQRKRCIKFTGFAFRGPCPPKRACWTWYMEEVPCTW